MTLKNPGKRFVPVSPGRPKGKLNKTNALLKEAILMAAENVGNKIGNNGMISYLEQQAVANPVAFLGLLGKVMPLQITGNAGGPIITKIELVAAAEARVEDDNSTD